MALRVGDGVCERLDEFERLMPRACRTTAPAVSGRPRRNPGQFGRHGGSSQPVHMTSWSGRPLTVTVEDRPPFNPLNAPPRTGSPLDQRKAEAWASSVRGLFESVRTAHRGRNRLTLTDRPPHGPPMIHQRRARRRCIVVSPRGRIDSTTSASSTDICRVVAGQTRVVVDFTGVDYISSAGLRVLLALAKRARPEGPRGPVRHERQCQTGLRAAGSWRSSPSRRRAEALHSAMA